jgi:hypothetical protein
MDVLPGAGLQWVDALEAVHAEEPDLERAEGAFLGDIVQAGP